MRTPQPVPDDVAEDYRRLEDELEDMKSLGRSIMSSFGHWIRKPARGAQLADLVDAHVRSGRPGSFIRLGDGEGSVLGMGDTTYPALSRFAGSSISRIHFGDPDALGSDPGLRSDLREAIASADGLGLLNLIILGVKSKAGGDGGIRGAWGLASVYRYLHANRETVDLAHKVGHDAGLHRSVLPHLGRLIGGRDIGLVSGRRELVPALCGKLGARSVELHPVPVQASRDSTIDTGHYPGRYRELCGELTRAVEGRLYLVGAGMPGKVYAHTIREAGGIALDLGSSLDVLSGHRTRTGITPELVAEHGIVDAVEADQPPTQT